MRLQTRKQTIAEYFIGCRVTVADFSEFRGDESSCQYRKQKPVSSLYGGRSFEYPRLELQQDNSLKDKIICARLLAFYEILPSVLRKVTHTNLIIRCLSTPKTSRRDSAVNAASLACDRILSSSLMEKRGASLQRCHPGMAK